MTTKRLLQNGKDENGFTLIELMAVLVIMGVLLSVAIKKYTVISVQAERRALLAGITELNTRETLTWANQLISLSGYQGDAVVWAAIDTDIGPRYSWAPGDPTNTGGDLSLGNQTESLTRSASTSVSAAVWSGP